MNPRAWPGSIARSVRAILGIACVASAAAAAESNDTPDMNQTFGLVIHGGAGTLLRSELTPELEAQHTAALEEALAAGYAVLENGGTALDAVIATIRILEDCPLFNAGVGAVMNNDGICELDASIMSGIDRSAGAVASVRRVRNPIVLARDVMERSNHVMLSGEGAERFAVSVGHELVDNSHFQTDLRRRQLEEAKAAEVKKTSASSQGDGDAREFSEFTSQMRENPDRKFGTVGCVALDQHGNLAAGTSTGGMTNKRFGRIGDSPVIGAGTYADNATCAVSSTGHGEYFIRAAVAHSIAARMRYGGQPLAEAAQATIDDVGSLGGTGGVIAIDREGHIALPFNTAGMYRAWHVSTGARGTAIYRE